jgi:hypothetical protein
MKNEDCAQITQILVVLKGGEKYSQKKVEKNEEGSFFQLKWRTTCT